MTASPDGRLVETLVRVGRATAWELVDSTALRFDAHHPQGMARVGDVWWITTVDIDRRRGWLLAVDEHGALLDRWAVGDDVRFHPGGVDFDGEALWVPSAEYRPRSTAVIERVATTAGAVRPEAAFTVDDHIGGVVRIGPHGDLLGWTWGSRRFLRWTTQGGLVREARHASHFVDYQDGQWLGADLVLCGGVATITSAAGAVAIGGIGVVRAGDLTTVREAPFPGYSPATGRPSTQNPLFAEVRDGNVLLHLLPDDGVGAILTYATPAR